MATTTYRDARPHTQASKALSALLGPGGNYNRGKVTGGRSKGLSDFDRKRLNCKAEAAARRLTIQGKPVHIASVSRDGKTLEVTHAGRGGNYATRTYGEAAAKRTSRVKGKVAPKRKAAPKRAAVKTATRAKSSAKTRRKASTAPKQGSLALSGGGPVTAGTAKARRAVDQLARDIRETVSRKLVPGLKGNDSVAGDMLEHPRPVGPYQTPMDRKPFREFYREVSDLLRPSVQKLTKPAGLSETSAKSLSDRIARDVVAGIQKANAEYNRMRDPIGGMEYKTRVRAVGNRVSNEYLERLRKTFKVTGKSNKYQ